MRGTLQSRVMTGRLRWTASFCLPLLLALSSVGCGFPTSEVASTESDTAFGTPTATLDSLDEEAIGEAMTAALLRNRMYTAMRLALPLDVVINGTSCHSGVIQTSEVYSFETAMACAIPETSSSGRIAGEVLFDGNAGVEVYDITLVYDAVVVPGAAVNGFEHIVEVVSEGGVTSVVLSLEHDGFLFDYSFRMGMLSEGSPAFDYEVETSAGVVLVRLTNPTTVGAYATATVTTVDGGLTCEIRNAAWSPGDPARGTCDDGTVYGL